MTQINEVRFAKLLTVPERVTDEQWTMSRWCGETECGTVACLAGWHAIMHPEEGLFADSRLGEISNRPGGKHMLSRDWAAHFGIERADAIRLFYVSEYSTQQEVSRRGVLARLRAFAASKGLAPHPASA